MSMMPKRKLEFEGSLTLAEDVEAGDAVVVHDSHHFSYFNHLAHPVNHVPSLSISQLFPPISFSPRSSGG